MTVDSLVELGYSVRNTEECLKPEILENFRRHIKRSVTISEHQQFFFCTLIKQLEVVRLADSELNYVMLPAVPLISSCMLLMFYLFL